MPAAPPPPAPVPTPPPRPARRLPLVLGAGFGVVVTVAAIAQVARTWLAERRIADRYGAAAAGCYYDGRPQGDCPVPRTGPHADTAWVRAAVLDTLYVRSAGHFGPPPVVMLAARVVVPGAGESPATAGADSAAAAWAALAGPADEGADALAARLRAAAPALPLATAAALVAEVRAARPAAPGDTLRPLWTVEGKQKRYAGAPLARVLAGRPASKQEALQTRGLLAFGPIAIGADRAWALAFAARAVPDGGLDVPARVDRAWVLLTRLADGKWRAVRVVPAEPAAAGAGTPAGGAPVAPATRP